jgi:hypothetical protein
LWKLGGNKSKRETEEEEGDEKMRREEVEIKKNNQEVHMVRLHYLHVWKYHDETPYYVQFTIC